jgi:hypothetical protein
MSISTKREVSHEPTEIEPDKDGLQDQAEIIRVIHSRKSSTSTKDKLYKIVKSSSSAEKPKLETLYSPNKGSPKVIQNHEDNENSNNKSKA